ncbi:hypothetical protein MCETARE7_00455 [Candidatus Nanopelagicaceae bacterium]
MGTRKLAIRILLAALFSSILPATLGVQSAWACTSFPNAPIVKTIWGVTGGPTFTVTPSSTGDLPTSIYYAYAIKKFTKKSFDPFVEWINVPVTSQATVIKYVPQMSSENEMVTFSAYASNNCGTSGQTQWYRKLVTNENLSVTKLDIAEDLPLSVGSIPNYFFSPMAYEIPQTLTSKTPTVCAFDESAKVLKLLSAGKCEFTISQNNELLETPNPDVTHIINILPTSKILADAQKDRPDEIPGFQIHVVYVKINGVPSQDFYQSGEINNWLNLVNAWMKRKIGKEFIFDTYQGTYDVSMMNTKYSVNELDIDSPEGGLTARSGSVLEKLRAEFIKQNGAALQGKNLLFVIDTKLAKRYCGFAQTGDTAVVTPYVGGCWYPEFGYLAQTRKLNDASATIAHELFHNLGVGHICEGKSDLMIGDGCVFPEKSPEITIDSKKKYYLGASAGGANIFDLKVWKDGSGVRHVQSKGVCYIKEPCLVSNGYWTAPYSDLEIQEKINGKWKTIQKFKLKRINAKKFIVNASIIPAIQGIHTYREYIARTKKYSAYVGKEFTKSVPY